MRKKRLAVNDLVLTSRLQSAQYEYMWKVAKLKLTVTFSLFLNYFFMAIKTGHAPLRVKFKCRICSRFFFKISRKQEPQKSKIFPQY